MRKKQKANYVDGDEDVNEDMKDEDYIEENHLIQVKNLDNDDDMNLDDLVFKNDSEIIKSLQRWKDLKYQPCREDEYKNCLVPVSAIIWRGPNLLTKSRVVVKSAFDKIVQDFKQGQNT